MALLKVWVCVFGFNTLTANYELAPQKGTQSTSYLLLTKPKLNRMVFENCRDSRRGLVGSVLVY